MLKFMILLIFSAILASCALYPTTPVRTQDFRDGKKPKKHLVILLSGRGASFDYFERQQWVAYAEQGTDDTDFVAPFLHYGYYMSGSVVSRLHEDIILPAKQQGYQTISLVGISMGGVGCLFYSYKYPDDIDRLYLFSPYLGKDDVLRQIRADGGLQKWHIRMEDEADWNYYIWQRLQQIVSDPVSRQKIFLGYGNNDKLKGHDLLAAAMPANHVISLPGNHDDVTFTKLWQTMVERGYLKR